MMQTNTFEREKQMLKTLGFDILPEDLDLGEPEEKIDLNYDEILTLGDEK